ncbi:hypothetical protein JYT72_02210, partial [Crocinitomix catalasitica]|nr:hypothetical protein [Crocinitomix catalasitica]
SQVYAFDLRAGLIPTSDGRFALVTGFRVEEPFKAIPPWSDILADLDAQIPSLDCIDQVIKFWNTNAYVAKYNADGTLFWDKSFDADNGPIENYPGDWKEQECLYRITEADGGSLVIVGNTSHNKDDYYIAKLQSDCALQKIENDEFDVFDDTFFETTIDDVVTWPDDLPGTPSTFSVAGTVRILFNGSLTIDGATVEMADSRKMPFPTRIIVERGGQLILKNGAKLTSLSDCGSTMWDGIQVWGDAADEQIPGIQGKLTMQSDATIENAIVGVACVKRENFVKDLDFTGGILNISDAHFINNLIGIEMRPYQNINAATGVLQDNVSFIFNTEFVINDELNDPDIASVTVLIDPETSNRVSELRAHQEFILLDDVRGIRIYGNDFTIESAVAVKVSNAERLGFGILSWDGQFYARALDAFPGDPFPKPNTFNNLWIGVNVKPISNVSDVVVDRAVFTGNHIGVAFDGQAYYSRVTRSTFNIPEATLGVFGSEFEFAHTGIYTQNAQGLMIEDNEFLGAVGSGNNAGIYVENAAIGGTSSEIYDNRFIGLDVGVQSAVLNGNLEIDCNEFMADESAGPVIGWHNVIDGFVTDRGDCNVAASAENPVANAFTGTYTSSFSILNQGFFFQYNSYDDIGILPPPGTTTGIFVNPCAGPAFNPDSACPARNVPPDFAGIILEIGELSDEIELLGQIIDGGDTDGLLDFIANTSSSVAIRNELLDHSPFLSDEVLISMLDKAGIQESKVKQILEANASLTPAVLLAFMSSPNNYSTTNIKKLILDSSPLRDEVVLLAAIDRLPELSSAFLKQILEANSPLRDETLLALLNRTIPI